MYQQIDTFPPHSPGKEIKESMEIQKKLTDEIFILETQKLIRGIHGSIMGLFGRDLDEQTKELPITTEAGQAIVTLTRRYIEVLGSLPHEYAPLL